MKKRQPVDCRQITVIGYAKLCGSLLAPGAIGPVPLMLHVGVSDGVESDSEYTVGVMPGLGFYLASPDRPKPVLLFLCHAYVDPSVTLATLLGCVVGHRKLRPVSFGRES